MTGLDLTQWVQHPLGHKPTQTHHHFLKAEECHTPMLTDHISTASAISSGLPAQAYSGALQMKGFMLLFQAILHFKESWEILSVSYQVRLLIWRKVLNRSTALCGFTPTKPWAPRPFSCADWRGFSFSPSLKSNNEKGGVLIHRCCLPEQKPTCWTALLLSNGILDWNWLGESDTRRWEWIVWLVFEVSLAGSWEIQHYVKSSVKASFSDSYFVPPCVCYWTLTVVQAEWPPLTPCPLVQVLWCPDDLDQCQHYMPQMHGLFLLSCRVFLWVSESSPRWCPEYQSVVTPHPLHGCGIVSSTASLASRWP